MFKKLSAALLYGAILSIPMILAGVLISTVLFDERDALEMTLFILGGIPIAIYLPSLISASRSGALHTPEVVYRKVGSFKPREKSRQGEGDIKAHLPSPAALVLAGLLTWLAGVAL
jgi:hypothetical protein